MRVAFLALAVQDLAAIRADIGQDSRQVAARLAAVLRQLIQRLADVPHRGKPGRVYGTRELVTPRIGKTADIIVYRVQGDRLEILRVLPRLRESDTILHDEPL